MSNFCSVFSILLSVVLTLISISAPVEACTAFNFTEKNGTFVGNNEDWSAGNPTIKVYPEKNGDFGRIYITYWWGLFWMPFAGVNQHGLMYDIFIADTSESADLDWTKSLRLGIGMATLAIKKCTNVPDVIELFQKYNLVMPGYQLFFTDREGNSVVIGGGEYISKEGGYQVVTNHLLSHRDLASEDSKRRYDKVTESLRDIQEVSVDKIASICKSVSKSFYDEKGERRDYPTQYSYVLDLQERRMYFFKAVNDDAVDYEKAAVLDIVEETSKPMHSFMLDSLDYRPLEECAQTP